MKIKPIFRWYDMYIGAYYDRTFKVLYLFPLPCLGLRITMPRRYKQMDKGPLEGRSPKIDQWLQMQGRGARPHRDEYLDGFGYEPREDGGMKNHPWFGGEDS